MNFILLIALMTLVTYIPRLLPFVIIKKSKIPEKLSEFLSFIPYAALGALILPGGINSIEGYPVLSASGLCLAAILSWFRLNIIFSMALTVAAVYCFL